MQNSYKNENPSAINKILSCFSWFGLSETEGISLNVTKYDIQKMKETDVCVDGKIHDELLHLQDPADRNILMIYEKRFRDFFKKIGNINQDCPYCSQVQHSLNVGKRDCTQCAKSFFVGKRVQDLSTVTYKSEEKDIFDLQWKVVSSVKKFQYYSSNEFEYIHKKLLKEGRKNLQESDVMQSLLDAYAKNSRSAGHFQLYAAFLFYKAELLRSQQRFAEAMIYYFYVHYLHVNGVTNKAEFGTNSHINSELKEKIAELTDLGGFQIRKMKQLYEFSIAHLNRFDENYLRVNVNKGFDFLVKEFREKDDEKEGIKPMRSFVLYSKAS